MKNCSNCEFSIEVLAYYSWYNAVWLRIFALSAFISNLFLISNRYLEIIKKKSFLGSLSKIQNLFISIIIPTFISLPSHFAIEVVKLEGFLKYLRRFNKFGSSDFFKAYFFLLLIIENVIPLVILIYLDIISIIKFKSLMEMHAHLTRNQIESKKAEERFTKMVLILSGITAVVRILDLLITIANRLYMIAPGQSNNIITLLKSIVNLILCMSLAFDLLVYLKMDKKIWKLVKTLMRLKKVIFWVKISLIL